MVLGRPGSGCSSKIITAPLTRLLTKVFAAFLKTLANRRAEYHAVDGEVHYDSMSPEELQKYFRGDVQYCGEDDVHFPTLSVEQTLHFAAAMRAPHEQMDHTRKQYINFATDVLTTVFGLGHARHTPVGDSSIRGLSGGEKKRLSCAESLVTRAQIGVWDK